MAFVFPYRSSRQRLSATDRKPLEDPPVIYALIALSTIAVSGVLAVRALIAGVAEHLEADDIPLAARRRFCAQPQRIALVRRTAAASRTSDAPQGRLAIARQRQAAV
jgi:hypothetical protein